MSRMSVDEILREIDDNFFRGARRKALPGLAIAFVGFLREIEAVGGKFSSVDELFRAHPPQKKTAQGKDANTLIVEINGSRHSIRGHYNAVEDYFRSEMKRFDYPSSAPHTTQSWDRYTHWLNAMVQLSEAELDELVSRAKQYVLDKLPSQDIDPSAVQRPPSLFQLFLDEFDLSAKHGEATGAAYQGTVFGFIRADAPHLQVEVGKVRTGSKREKRVGDIDARDGEALVLSAEVKQFDFKLKDMAKLAEFSNLISKHKALGLVVALSFEEGVREQIEALGLLPVDRTDLSNRVKLWDPLKQRIAISALLYYANFREQNSALYARIKAFIESKVGASEQIILPGSADEDQIE